MDEKIIEKYNNGESVKEISDELRIGPSAVYWVLKKNNIRMKTHREAALIAVTKGRIKTGDKSPYWNGGKCISYNGYEVFSSGKNKNRPVHTVIIEEIIGRKIKKGEVVHHINGIKTDNRIENLKLISSVEHGIIHSSGRKHTEKSRKKMSLADRSLTSGENNCNWVDVPLERIIFALGLFSNRKDAAKYLGIHRTTLKEKMHYYGVYKNGTIKNIKLSEIVDAIKETDCIAHAAKKLLVAARTVKNKLTKFNLTYDEIKNG